MSGKYSADTSPARRGQRRRDFGVHSLDNAQIDVECGHELVPVVLLHRLLRLSIHISSQCVALRQKTYAVEVTKHSHERLDSHLRTTGPERLIKGQCA